jgi:hypothetical protein
MKLFNRKEAEEKRNKAFEEEIEDIKDAIVIYMKPNKVYTAVDLLLSIEECKDLTVGRLQAILYVLTNKEKIIGKTKIIRDHRTLTGYYTTIHA